MMLCILEDLVLGVFLRTIRADIWGRYFRVGALVIASVVGLYNASCFVFSLQVPG